MISFISANSFDTSSGILIEHDKVVNETNIMKKVKFTKGHLLGRYFTQLI